MSADDRPWISTTGYLIMFDTILICVLVIICALRDVERPRTAPPLADPTAIHAETFPNCDNGSTPQISSPVTEEHKHDK